MKYYLTENLLFLEDVGEYKSYGIELRKGKRVIERIDDIDTKREGVEALCKLCNELELSPIHLRDIIDDYLSR